jgi:hypothetical protein
VVDEPAPTLEVKARLEQLAALLNQSATGSDLLKLKEAYEVRVRDEGGRGSSSTQVANRIPVGTNRDWANPARLLALMKHDARTVTGYLSFLLLCQI